MTALLEEHSVPADLDPYLRVGRYALYDEIASGGMAKVHIGRLLGPRGFSRTVAIKRLHAAFARDREFAAMFLDEALMAARLRHPNVVPIHDVIHAGEELFLVMDYVEGESLWRLVKLSRDMKEHIPVAVAVGIAVGVLHGLHAAHEARSDSGDPLGLVHRDVSPQNILVGLDGTPRVLDFGIAKAKGRLHNTVEGQVKGKLGYMAPEQIGGDDVDRQADVYAAGTVLWELLAGRRRFRAQTDVLLLAQVLEGATVPPSQHRPEVTRGLDELIMKAVSRDLDERFQTARDFAQALERTGPFASASQIGAWVEEIAGASLSRRAQVIAKVESQPSVPSSIPEPGDGSWPASSSSTEALLERQVDDRTQLSRQSAEPPARPRRTQYLAIAAAALAVVGGAAVGMRPVPPEAVTVATVAMLPALERGPRRERLLPTSEPLAPASSEPSATRPHPRYAPARRGVQPPPSPEPPPPTPTPQPTRRVGCDPPYTVDERGVQRLKPQCL
jgi:eukaryotic-like serine/threonine-protein kinase